VAEKDARIDELTTELERRAAVAAEKDVRVDELTRERNQRIASITAEKDARIEGLEKELERRVAHIAAEKDEHIAKLGKQVTALTEELEKRHVGAVVPNQNIAELKDRYKELEGNYFEMQMENIRLKGEVERLNAIASE
jgi:chromosome segregation ATPase